MWAVFTITIWLRSNTIVTRRTIMLRLRLILD